MNASTAIRTCEVCGASIDHLRSDATTCGSTCRGRKLRAKGPRCGWCSRRIGPGRRYGSAYCLSACERADETARKTDMRPFDLPSKVMTADVDPDACTRCGSRAGYRDEDGRWCLMCGRLREAA